ncbi:MAG: hypothetical protein HUJ76_01055 [Parasporobacterium sp.]|nr:hypothetical protein [Parasporobacterium sp.]
MKSRIITLILAGVLILSLFTLSGCSGIIKPQIGENYETAADTSAESGEEGDGQDGESQGGEAGSGESGSSESEAAAAPAMAGTVTVRFYETHEQSSSLGGINVVVSTADLYDQENTEGKNALIAVKVDSSVSYTTGKWTETEDGQIAIAIDEFTTYTTMDIDGVRTLTGVRYSAGMGNTGEVSIPEQKDFDAAAVTAANAEAASAAESAEAADAGDSEAQEAQGESSDAEAADSEGGADATQETQGDSADAAADSEGGSEEGGQN